MRTMKEQITNTEARYKQTHFFNLIEQYIALEAI